MSPFVFSVDLTREFIHYLRWNFREVIQPLTLTKRNQAMDRPSNLSRRDCLKSAIGVTAMGLSLTVALRGGPKCDAASGDSVAEANLPQVTVSSVRRVFHNGEHNAFTDLCRYRGQLYLAFRSCPDGHMVHPTASIIVLSSPDGAKWEQVHRFRVEQRDTRDPHLLVFRDKLFVYTGTWYSGKTTLPREDYDLNKHLGYAAWSEDGVAWHSPILLEGTFGHYIWRAASFGGTASFQKQ